MSERCEKCGDSFTCYEHSFPQPQGPHSYYDEIYRLRAVVLTEKARADKAEARVAGETLRGRIAECDAIAAWVIATVIATRDGTFTEPELLNMLEQRQNEARRALEEK